MMQVLKITQLAENLWALDEISKTNMFVIKGSKYVLLVDTGFGLSDLKEVVKGLCGDMPVKVINTHAHLDHDSGNNQFDTVMVGWHDELAALWPLSEAEKLRCITGFFGPMLKDGYDLNQWNPGPAKHIEPVSAEDRIDLGDMCLEVIETPGHTCGSISLFEPNLGWLFTGDMILTWEVWGQLTRGAFGSSSCLRYYSRSLNFLESLLPKVKDVFPAHGKDIDNPPGYTHYRMPPDILRIYAQGTRDIVNGKVKGEPYDSMGGFGRCVYFEVGGMAYNPDRI
ncbi:MAG: MBL fold metallo-hydrolase [Treponema sp.]|jgi:glyoxylase-like metal-dependent hydrolase (beta-lactamase superfamily II)|nr:MBL fold metallo-hydrolase [Treponema sp.]